MLNAMPTHVVASVHADAREAMTRLDELLTDLERLNLCGAVIVPEQIRERLAAEGIPLVGTMTPSDLIERVFESQLLLLRRIRSRPFLGPEASRRRASR